MTFGVLGKMVLLRKGYILSSIRLVPCENWCFTRTLDFYIDQIYVQILFMIELAQYLVNKTWLTLACEF